MNFKASVLFASRLIFPRTEKKSTARKSILGAVLCIGLCIIPLVVVLTITDSMISGMTERIINLTSSHAQCFLKYKSDYARDFGSFMDFSEKFKKIPGVTNTFPEINASGLISNSSFRTGCQIRAVDFKSFFEDDSVKNLLELDGKTGFTISENYSNEKIAFIGSKIAQDLNLKKGDEFKLITTKKSVSDTIIPKVTAFKVCGIVSSGYQEIDALWVFIPVETGYELLSNSSSVMSVLIKTQDPFSAELGAIINECKKTASVNGKVYSWQQMNQSKFENFQSTKIMLFFILLLIIIVASINISSAIIMLIMERQKEIAILKSCGATSSGITVSFVITGVFCGISGLLAGLPVGLLISININQIIQFFEKTVNFCLMFFDVIAGKTYSEEYVHLLDPAFYLTNIPVQIPYVELLLSSLFVVLLSFTVSLIPAVKAGKQKPLDIFTKN